MASFEDRLKALREMGSATLPGVSSATPAAKDNSGDKKNVFERLADAVSHAREGRVDALENTADYYRKQATENPDTRTWLQKGTLSDGYRVGDISKGVAASVGDLAENVGAGILGLGEKFADATKQLGAWSYGGLTQSNPGAALPSYSFSLEDREKEKQAAQEFISKDLYDEKAISKNIVGAPSRWLGLDTQTQSFLGEKTDALAQSGGQLAGTALAQLIGVPWFLTTGLSSFGGALEEAYNEGADFDEAGTSAAITAAAETLSEKLAGGIKFGGKTLDDFVTDKLSKAITDKALRIFSKTAWGALGEGGEEVLSGFLSAIGKQLTYADDKTLAELFTKEEAMESFISGVILGGGIGLVNNIRTDVQPTEKPTANKPQISPSDSPIAQAANDAAAKADPNQGASGEANIEAGSNYVRIKEAPAGNTKSGVAVQDGVTAGPLGTSNDTVAQQQPAVNVNDGIADLGVGVLDKGVGAAAESELSSPFTKWRDNSTAPEHKMGEKAVRYLGVPTIDPQGRHTMKTGQTIAEAKVTTDENAALIENLYVNGDLSYVPKVDRELAQRAEKDIERKGWAESVKDWTVDVRNGKVKPELVAMGAQLLNNAGQAGNASAEEYASLVLDYSDLLHNAGQSLQAARILKMLTPEGKLYGIQKSVQKMAQEAGEKYDIRIPNELIDKYRKAKTDAERDSVITEMQKNIAERLPSNFIDKWTALRYVNMLGNFKTQIRNLSGNLFMKAQYFAKNEVATLIETIANALSGGKLGRSKSFAVGSEWMQAAKADFANVKNTILANGKYSGENFIGEFARGVDQYRKVFKNSGEWGAKDESSEFAKITRNVTDALWKVPEAYRVATNWAMDTGDIIFGKAAYARALSGYLKANGIQPQQLMAGNVDAELLDKARAYAIKQAQETTFRDDNAFSNWVSRIGRRADTPKPVKAITEGLLPFRRTPANVLLRAEEFSPLGLINTAVKAARSRKADSNITASDIIDSLAKTLTGSGLMALGYMLADQGLLRATGSDEDEEYDALMNIQDWSIVIPGVGTYTFDWAAPSSLIMFMGAQLNELASDEELSFSDIEGAFTGLGEPLIQMSMLSGVNDTLDSIKYSDNNLIQMAGQLAVGYLSQGLTNTLLGQIERSTEAERMSTYTEADSPLPEWFQRSIGKASAKTPVWEYQQTEYLNEFGETEESNVGERILENLFSPGYFEAEKTGGAYDVVTELRERLGVDAFPDAYPPDTVKYAKENYALSQEERSRYQQTRGQTAADYLEAVDKSEEFNRLTSKQQTDIIEEIMERANNEAKNEALGNRGVKVEQSEMDRAVARMTAAQYIDWLVDGATAKVPETYKSNPDWQQFERAADVLPPQLALSMMYAYNDVAAKKVDKAMLNGVSIDDAVAYYRAITAHNTEGKSPGKAEVNQRIAALGLDNQTRSALIQAFKDEKNKDEKN